MPISDRDPENNEISDSLSGDAASRPDQPLVLYEAARFALSEARRVDEVKDIRDKMVALQVYARQAKDTKMIEDATEIRMRAERRVGELLKEAEKNKGAQGTGSNQYEVRSPDGTAPPSPPTLAELGVTKKQSSEWQKLARLPENKFEAQVEHAKARAKGKRAPASPEPKPSKKTPNNDPIGDVADCFFAKARDGVWRPLKRLASIANVAPSAAKEALERLGDNVEQRTVGGTVVYLIKGGDEAELKSQLAAKDAEIAELKQTIAKQAAEIEFLQEFSAAPAAAPAPDLVH